MMFNVSGLVQDGVGATRRYEIDADVPIEGRGPEHVVGWVKLMRTPSGVLVQAEMEATERETCSRCLKPVDEALKIAFEEEFIATVDATSGRPILEKRDADAFLIDSNHILDLNEAVRQYREAVAEIAPLCRPDCRGLCPRCGRDLNAGDCDCETVVGDSRWAGLAALLQDDNGGEGKSLFNSAGSKGKE